MHLRLPDPSATGRLAAFLRSVGVAAVERGPDLLELEGEVDRGELAIYLRVWAVLHPEAAATVEE